MTPGSWSTGWKHLVHRGKQKSSNLISDKPWFRYKVANAHENISVLRFIDNPQRHFLCIFWF